MKPLHSISSFRNWYLKHKPHNILFVCQGNICRSPMAEYLFNHYMAKTVIPTKWIAKSAGIRPVLSKATEEAVMVMSELGIDISGHRSQIISVEILKWADIIFVMEPWHIDRVMEKGGYLQQKAIMMLGNISPKEKIVKDPYGDSIAVYRKTRDMLYDMIVRLIGEIKDVPD